MNLYQTMYIYLLHSHSVGSESVPSPNILTWLSLQLHEDLQNEDIKEVSIRTGSQTIFTVCGWIEKQKHL